VAAFVATFVAVFTAAETFVFRGGATASGVDDFAVFGAGTTRRGRL